MPDRGEGRFASIEFWRSAALEVRNWYQELSEFNFRGIVFGRLGSLDTFDRSAGRPGTSNKLPVTQKCTSYDELLVGSVARGS